MKKILFGVMIIMALIGASCDVGLGPELGGTIRLSFDDGVTARTILPTQSMDIATYDIYGVHTDTAKTFEQLGVPVGSSIVISDMNTGEWTLTVDGRNAAASVIGTGSTTVIVNPASQVTANVNVVPIVGDGTLNIGVTWSAAADAQMTDPDVVSDLLSYSGATTPLVYIVDQPNLQAGYSGDHANGYYTLITKFVDKFEISPGIYEATIVAGNAEVVRIAAGDITSGSYHYDNINTGDHGAVEIVIDPDLGDPLVIDLSPDYDGATFTSTDSFTVTASTTSTTDLVDYTWYLNGEEIGTGATITVDAGAGISFFWWWFNPEFFANLSVVGFSNGGYRGGSTSIDYTVVQ